MKCNKIVKGKIGRHITGRDKNRNRKKVIRFLERKAQEGKG